MVRKAIPKKVKDSVLKEYDHRCSICGQDRPQIHHIDEDHENNEVVNLLPLCPNCHLSDQHNPTKRIDIPKLQMFRIHKDPSILKPQFHPIYTRQTYLDEVEINYDSTSDLEKYSNELVEFIAVLEMGDFYSKRISELTKKPSSVYIMAIGGGRDHEYEQKLRDGNKSYREMLNKNNEEIRTLLVELLRYQSWANS